MLINVIIRLYLAVRGSGNENTHGGGDWAPVTIQYGGDYGGLVALSL